MNNNDNNSIIHKTLTVFWVATLVALVITGIALRTCSDTVITPSMTVELIPAELSTCNNGLYLQNKIFGHLLKQDEYQTQHELETELKVEELTEALLQTQVVWNNPNSGNPTYAYECRTSRYGCEETIKIYARMFVRTGFRLNLDPFLLAAIAKHESNLNAFAVGSKGERGIMQILPYSPVANNVAFVRSEAYRNRCQREEGHCQANVIFAASEAIQSSLGVCNGSMEQALVRYNTGKCTLPKDSTNRYAPEVLKWHRTLLSTIAIAEPTRPLEGS